MTTPERPEKGRSQPATPEEAEAPGTAASDETLMPGAPPADQAPPLDAREAAPKDEHWGRYTIQGLLGSGGIGVVYKAYDELLRRHVALKRLRVDDPGLISRLLHEAWSQAKVQHDHICRIYDAGVYEGRPYIAMQLIEGRTLREAAQEMTLEQKVGVVRKVADALHEAHKQGLIHRDIKPDNIMIERTPAGEWKPYVMDFGIAKEIGSGTMTLTGMLVGTPMYMAPEQAAGETSKLDRRTDVYALGVTMYELFSGKRPFEMDTAVSILRKIAEEDPSPLRKIAPHLPPDLEAVVMKCLEKEPGRRYDSANALSEDLRRFLADEPVRARRISGISRLARRARRHKTLTAVITASLAAVMVLGGYAVRTRLQARSQALAAQRFGIEIKDIEAMHRYSCLSPLHDTRPDTAALRRRMTEITRMIEELGGTAAGPGNYALGRGYLALHDYRNARSSLQRAWDSGYRDPMVALTLGRVLGALYQEELEGIRGINDAALRDVKRKEIEKTYREPAAQYLSLTGTGVSESPRYVEGLIAFYERDYHAALKHAKAARRRASWLYEAAVLEGDVHQTLGMELQDKGEYQAAVNEWATAESSYHDALEIARSDPQIYDRLGTLWAGRMRLELWETGGDLAPWYDKAMEAGRSALQADSGRAETYERLAEVQWLFGEFQKDHGHEASRVIELCDRAIEFARMAIGLRSDSPKAFFHMGVAYSLRGLVERNSGADPRPTLQKATDSLSRATALDPSFERAYTRMGITNFWAGQWEAAHGINPEGRYKAALECYQKAIQVQPQVASPYANMGSIYAELAVYATSHGTDPGALLGQSVSSYRKALELNPHYLAGVANLGAVLLMKGEGDLRHGRDPRETLLEAAELLTKAHAAHPTHKYTMLNAGLAEYALAEYAYDRGDDPRSPLNEARRWYAQIVTQSGEDIEALDLDGRCRLLEARHALDRGQPPGPSLDGVETMVRTAGEAGAQSDWFQTMIGQLYMLRYRWMASEADFKRSAAALRKAVELNAEGAPAQAALAELYLERARKGTDAGRAIDLGLSAADRAVSLDQRLAVAHLYRGLLLLTRARLTAEPPTRRDAASESRDALAEAFEQNPLLKRQYGKYLSEAEVLLAS